MTQALITAVAPRWEADLAGALARSRCIHVARRCADVAELLGVAAAGVGSVAVVSSDLRQLDRGVVDTLREHGLKVLGVHPPEDAAAPRTLRRWGLAVVVPADAGTAVLDEALQELLDPPASTGVEHQDGGGSSAQLELRATPDGPREVGDLPATGGSSTPATVSPRRSAAPDSRSGRGEDTGPPAASETPRSTDADQPPSVTEPDHPAGQVIVVWGPHGSPGRTTVAVNLAAELAHALEPVILVDADTHGASIGQHLAILDEVPGVAAAARLADQGALDPAQLADLAPEVRPGLRVLTGLPRADRWPELREAALADVLEACRELARWTIVDVSASLEHDEELSFDTLAPRRNGAALTALDAADHVVVVGAGDPVGLQRLVRGLDLLTECSTAPRTVVITRVRPGAVGQDPGRRIAEALDRFAGVRTVELVPEDQESLDASLLHGQVLAEVRPKSPARAALVSLADQVADRQPTAARREPRTRSLGWLAAAVPRHR